MKNIIITGSGRSGTSMLAGLFNKAGYYYGDNLYPPREANPKGFFEDEEINRLNEKIIFSNIIKMGIDDDELKILKRIYEGTMWLFRAPVNWAFIANNEQKEEIKEYVNKVPFCFKDPRFCYTLENWLELAQNSVVLCVYRDPASTVHSILKECRTEPYLYSVNIGVSSSYKIWTSMYLRMLEAYIKYDNVYFINYDDVISGSIIPDIEKLTGAQVDSAFPEVRLSRSKPDYEPDRNAEIIYAALKEISGCGNISQNKSSHIELIKDLKSKIDILDEFSLSLSTSRIELNAFLELVSTDVFSELKNEIYKLNELVIKKDDAVLKLNELVNKKDEAVSRAIAETTVKQKIECQKIIDSYALALSWRLTYPFRWLRSILTGTGDNSK